MKNNILQRLSGLFGSRKKQQGREETDEQFLYNHRLKKASIFPLREEHASRNTAGKFFLSFLMIAFAAMPFAHALAATFLTLDSFSGHPATIHASSGGWVGGEHVAFYLGSTAGSPFTTVIADGTGNTGLVDVIIPPSTPQGPLGIFAVGGASHATESNSYYVVPFSPSIAAASSPNTPGSSVPVHGSGFAAGETVNFFINSGNVGHVTVNSSGSFTGASLVIPNVAAGTYQLHGIGAASGADAVYYLYVGGFFPSASPTAYYVLPGDTLSFSGSGFASGEFIRVTQGADASVLSTITANGSGGFSAAGGFTVPLSLAGGVRTFHLRGGGGHLAPDVMVTVGTFNGNITPSAYYLNPGDVLNFSGNGFAPGEGVDVFIGTSRQATFSAGSDGTFADRGHIPIPFSFAGSTKTFSVKGQSSNTGGSVDITVGGFFPSLTPSSYFVLPGQQFHVSGSGFAGGESIHVSMGSDPPLATTTTSGGMFTAGPFTAPLSGGPIHVVATGGLSGVSAAADVTLGTLYPSVSPSAWYVLPGSNISFTGSGFAPGEPVAITSGMVPVGTVTANSSGAIATGNFAIPFGAGGNKAYLFSGNSSHATASVTITVAGLSPYADADTYYITPGSTVHVSGHNFAPGETVQISVGGNTASGSASISGNVGPVAIVIPFGGTSPAVVVLTGGSSGVSANVPITLAPFTPQMNPDTWYTAPGTTVHFSGSGFAAGETVAVTLNGSAAGSAAATASGTVNSFGITIPFSATMAHFVFTSFLTHANIPLDITVAALHPGIVLSTYYDQGGQPLTITGMGFGANEPIALTFGGTILPATADHSGNFIFTGTIPFGPAGNVSVQARGSNSGAMTSVSSFTRPQVYTSVRLGAYAGAPGAAVTVIGSGFLPNEPVTITTDRTSGVQATLAADPVGSLSDSSWHIPVSLAGGPLTITISGTHSFASTSIVYYVTGP